MAIITTGQTFTATDTVTNTKLQDIADAATFNDPVDETTLELIIGGSNAGKLGIKDAGVTKAKIENVANLRVLGNTSGSVVAPQEVEILDDDTMATATATTLATSESIKAYADSLRPKFFSLTGGTNSLASGNQTSSTITWNIADYTSSDAGFDTSKITAVVIYSLVSSSTENTAFIEASLPNGQLTTIAKIKDGGTDSNTGTSATTYNLPINKDQSSFSIVYGAANSTAETTIRGVILN